MMLDYNANDPILIQAAKESGLSYEYQDDPDLLTFLMKRLPRRGWAGIPTATESKYSALV